MNCLRCGAEMKNAGEHEIQLGSYSFLFGHLGNLLSGSLETEIYICPNCKKVEFFCKNELDFE